MIDEGVIKFNHIFINKGPHEQSWAYEELERIRQVIKQINLIGIYSGNIGYGNLSLKQNYNNIYPSKRPQFIITATQTGHLTKLTNDHYSKVVEYNITKNEVKVIGKNRASSESLTHASIYQASSKINCIIHIHNNTMWKELLHFNYPKIPKHIAYGTQEIAQYAQKLIQQNDNNEFKLFVMEGHQDGVIFFHEDSGHCLNNVLAVYKKFCS